MLENNLCCSDVNKIYLTSNTSFYKYLGQKEPSSNWDEVWFIKLI